MKPKHWRRSAAGKWLRHVPRVKQLRGTWLHRWVGDRLLNPHLWQPEREPIARGFAIGGFFSVLQFPFQSLPAVILAVMLRGNVPAALVACWISNPFTAAPILWLELELGFRLLGMGSALEAMQGQSIWAMLKQVPGPFAVGAIALAPVTALIAYFASKVIYDFVRVLIERSAHRRRPKAESGPDSPPAA